MINEYAGRPHGVQTSSSASNLRNVSLWSVVAKNVGRSWPSRVSNSHSREARNVSHSAISGLTGLPRAGCARYEFTHGLTTDALAWRFEFMSSTEAVDSHFVVEQGAPTRRGRYPIGDHRRDNRVISSYVKQLRLEMNSGSMKYANWLAELIKRESVPPVPSDPDAAALIAAKASNSGCAAAPPSVSSPG